MSNPVDRDVLTIILAGGKGDRLEPLTRHRTKPAVPFGGVYRIIDFALSNCFNSGLRKIFVLIQYKCNSLLRHLKLGWDIFSRALDEFIDPIPPQQRVGESWYLGTADAVFQNLYSIESEDPEHVLILAGDHIYKMDYNNLIGFHVEAGADMTLGVVEVAKEDACHYGILQTDQEGRIMTYIEKPDHDPLTLSEDPRRSLASMGICIFKTDVLKDVLRADANDSGSSHDFGRDIIPAMLAANFKLFAMRFIDENRKKMKYWRDVGTLDSYYQANVDLVSVDPLFNLYDDKWPVRTFQVQAPPPKFVHFDESRSGIALNSLVCQGCIISGGRVFGSILSPFVRVNSFAEVHDSILFEGVQVGRYARIKRAIIDKDVVIPEGMQIGYNLEEDRARFAVTDTGIVVIPKGERV